MIISLTIWLASLIFIGVLFAGKRRELKGGAHFVHIGSSAFDQKIIAFYREKRTWLKQCDGKYIAMHLHAWAEYMEKAGLGVAEKMVLRLSQARDLAIGKDIHKNKGHIDLRGIFRKLMQ